MTIFLIIILLLSIAINGVLGYATYNVLSKNELLEDYIANSFLEAKRTLNDMRAIDNMEMFEKDEDVGQVFQQMLSIIEDYALFLGVEEEDEEVNDQQK